MDNKEFKQELINEILLNVKPSYYKNFELNVGCPFCGDLVKNANSTHLSIRINKTWRFYLHVLFSLLFIIINRKQFLNRWIITVKGGVFFWIYN